MPGRAFIDSNIWLYTLLVAENDPRAAMANRLIDSIDRAVISSQVIREITSNLVKKRVMPEASVRALISNLYTTCEVVHADQSQFLHASRLREILSISYWDSLIVASARAGCEKLYTEDMNNGQLIEGSLHVANPFALK